MTSTKRAKLIQLAFLTASILAHTLPALWLLPALLDESYLTRTTLIVLLGLAFGVSLLLAIASMVVQAQMIGTRSLFTSTTMPYYMTALVLGVVEVLLASVFIRQTMDVSSLGTSTFTDPDDFKSIFVYRTILEVVLGAWFVRVYSYLHTSISLLEQISRLGFVSTSMGRGKHHR